MRAEVIAIGDEISSGQRLDTNSQWLSQRLGELGVAVGFHTTVADDLESNVAVFRAAVERADIVVATGGLGPTADDLTREALAACIDRPLVLNEAALQHVVGIFARRGREMPERNKVQAYFPEGSRMIHNPEGTAPGVEMEIPREGRGPCRLFALPGVPAEMFQMWRETVAPALAGVLGVRQVIRHHRLKCFGVGESALEKMLPDLIRRGRDPSVGITVHEATITLRITALGDSPEHCRQRMAETEATVRECLGSLVFGEEDDELEDVVLRRLAQRGETLATCEAGGHGLLSHWLNRANPTPGPYWGGVHATCAAAQIHLAGISDDLFSQYGPASSEAARAMALHIQQTFHTDYALALSSFPSPQLPGQPLPHFHIALATPTGVSVHPTDYSGHSAILQPLAAKRALNLLRLKLS